MERLQQALLPAIAVRNNGDPYHGLVSSSTSRRITTEGWVSTALAVRARRAASRRETAQTVEEKAGIPRASEYKTRALADSRLVDRLHSFRLRRPAPMSPAWS